MTEPATIPPGEARQLLAERERAQVQAAQLGAGQGSAPATAAPPPGAAAPETEVDPSQLMPLVSFGNLMLTRMGAEPITEMEASMWCGSAAPVMAKYGGKLPFMEEALFVLTTAAVFGPRVWQIRAKAREAAEADAKPAPATPERKAA